MGLSVVHVVEHLIVAALVAPLMIGVINKTKAAFGGRRGPPVLQPYYDLAKLFRKGTVLSVTTTWIFLAGPVVGLVTVMLPTLLLPMGDPAPISFWGDALLMAALLALGRFFTASAALDTGSAFEGMGAAREVTFACFAEPALFFGLLVTSKLSNSLRLSEMLSLPHNVGGGAAVAAIFLVLVSWFILLLTENCRIPFDDPNTHLELTMIHEVMVLDHGGPALGMILYGAAIKLFVFATLITRLLLPATLGTQWWAASALWVLFLGSVLGVAVLVGIVEATMARLRMMHIPTLLVAAGVLSAFGLILLVSPK